MRTALTVILLLPCALLGGCGSPFRGETLVALEIRGEPGAADWERAVPLDVRVWKGNVHLPAEIVALDLETTHRSTAQCHHGTSNSDPVDVRLQALYNNEELFIMVQWSDGTQDRDLGTWSLGPEGWTASPGADDGVAILWEPPGPAHRDETFRCQNACHMVEVDVYDGGTKMRMGMKSPSEEALDLWRWRSAVTETFGVADDMVVDGNGKRGDEGQALPVPNRSETGPGPSFAQSGTAPYYVVRAPAGRQSDVSAAGRWERGRWRVLLSRALDTGDPDDVPFAPGEPVPFSISVFDNTFTEHHVSGDSAVLVLERGAVSPQDGRKQDDPMDF